jgi:hypothetical protein
MAQQGLVFLLKAIMGCAFMPPFRLRLLMPSGQKFLALPSLVFCLVFFPLARFSSMVTVSMWWVCWINNICQKMLLWSVVLTYVVTCSVIICPFFNGFPGYIMGVVMHWLVKQLQTDKSFLLLMACLKTPVLCSMILPSHFHSNLDSVSDAPVYPLLFRYAVHHLADFLGCQWWLNGSSISLLVGMWLVAIFRDKPVGL